MAGGFAGQPRPRAGRLVTEVEGDEPAVTPLPVELRAGVLHPRARQIGGAEPEPAPVLVGKDQFPGLLAPIGLFCLRGRLTVGEAVDGMEGQLGGPAQHLGGFPRVGDVGEFDEDTVLAGTCDGRLRDPQRVDPLAQDLDRAVGALAVRGRGRRVAGLENDPGAAL